ncbi:MAG: threonine/serine dehydratase [Proteobacteria bacterium]|nr:threonine/serine dehydratase [Pseudomonadota bacterium]
MAAVTPALPTAESVLAAAARIAPYRRLTPLLTSPALDALTGAQVFLKAEVLQHTRSFKYRGALSKLLTLGAEARQRGVVAWSSGNHGQAVAAAGARLAIPVTVVMPKDAPAIKRRHTEAHGARVILFDRQKDDREAIAFALAEREGLTVVPSFDDAEVIAGQGTAGLEMRSQLKALGLEADRLLVCTGGGGFMAGCALAFEGTTTRLHTVEPEGYDDHARSFESGTRQRIAGTPPSDCDALLTPTPGALTFAINQPRVTSGLVVSAGAVHDAMRFAFEHLAVVLEPGGAVCLAALLTKALPLTGEVVLATLSGGNVDPRPFAEVLRSA